MMASNSTDKSYKTLVLFDASTSVQHKMLVTEDIYNKAFADLQFAQQLLANAMGNCDEIGNNDNNSQSSCNPEAGANFMSNEISASGSQEANNLDDNNATSKYTISDDEDAAAGTDNTSTSTSTSTWQYDETVCLIRSMEVHLDDLNHPKKKKHVFSNVSNDLLSAGFNQSPEKCHIKWKNLLRSYKSTKDHKTKTGRGPSRFLFFSQMDEILGEKPSNSCKHTLDTINLNETPQEPQDKTSKTEGKKRKFCEKKEYIALKRAEFERKERRESDRKDQFERKMALEEQKVKLLQEFLLQTKNCNN